MSTLTKYSKKPQRLAMPAWYLVKEFAGIYGVKMNYGAVKEKLNRDMISHAYFEHAKVPLVTGTITYNNIGQPERLSSIKSNDWISLILKRAATGYSNRKFYESLAYQIENVDKIKQEQQLTDAELLQVNEMRNNLQNRIPGMVWVLTQAYNNDIDKDYWIDCLIGGVFERDHPYVASLFNSKKETAIAALFANGTAN